MRVDRFLFFIRLLKSRTQAQGLIDEGHLRIDGTRVVKHGEEVRVGSVIAFPLHGRVRVLRVVEMPKRRGPSSEARTCYEEMGPLSREGQTLTSRSLRHSEAGKRSEFS